MSTVEIAIRSIQHYLYCPHRWGLLEIDRAWAENAFVTKANLLHERVHDPNRHYTARGKQVFTAIPVYNDLEQYNLYGVTDCIEGMEDESGAELLGYQSRYKLCIVEYKPTQPKNRDYNDEDLMQVFAQKICVDYVFGCDCDGEIYYADTKKRVKLPLKENFPELDYRLEALLSEMRNNMEKGNIPPIQKGQYCSGCSMKDLCMPSTKKMKSVRSSIEEIGEQEL